jgi:hypothetical protein
MELTKPIQNVVGTDIFRARLEKKYGSQIIDHHLEQGFGVYEFANGDEVRYWDERKLIGNPFGRRGKDNKIPAHFTNTKYSEFGYKPKGESKFITNTLMSFGAGDIAYAKRIGLSDADIRQAYKEGIGNADDVREALDKFVLQQIEVRSIPASKIHYSVGNKSKTKRNRRVSTGLGTVR